MSHAPTVLRWYQHDAVEAVFKDWETHNSTMIVMATGLGKTVTFCEVVRRLHPKRCIIIAHRTELIEQACASLNRIGLKSEIEMAEKKADASMFFEDSTIVASVQSLISGKKDSKRMTKFNPEHFGCLICDEFHHGISKSYREVFDHFRKNPNLKILGVTATPDRYDEKAMGLVCDSVAFKFDIADAINDGWLVPIQQQLVRIASLDYSHVRTTAGDLNGADLARIMEDEKNLQGMVGASIEIIGTRKSIAFTSSVRHAEMCCDIFNRHRAGMADWICGDTSDEDRKKILRRFKHGEVQVLANVGIATEGFDCLDTKTEVLTPNGWFGVGAIDEGNHVYGFDTTTFQIKSVPALRAFCRDVKKGEMMVSARSQHIDLRTTEGHLFHIRKGRRKFTPFSTIRTGLQMVHERTEFSLPISGFCDFSGVPLSDDELRFVAWFMTDGGFVGSAVTISQSKDYKSEIRKLLVRIGLDFTERTRQMRGYENSKPLTEFRIPKGVRTGTLKRNGWIKYERYLYKDVSPFLHDMTRDQFSVFWSEALKGDGSNYKNGKSGWLWCCDKKQADAYTEMAVLRGFSASYAPEKTKTGKIVYRVSVRDVRSIAIYQNDARATQFVLEEPQRGERVWCVENELGTLITRRNGKICIIGNCPDVEIIIMGRATKSRSLYTQMVGRSTRPLPGIIDGLNSSYERREAISESAKPSATILDFVGNSGKHKLMTTADILGGDYTEEEKEEALKDIEKSGKPKRISDAIKELRERIERQKREEAARKARLIAKVHYSSKPVSPFDAFDIKPKADSKWDTGAPLTSNQRAVLQKIGVNPDEIGKAAAKQLLLIHFKRIKEGLCSVKQAQLLKKHGYEPKKMTFQEASRIIDELKNHGWKRTDLILT